MAITVSARGRLLPGAQLAVTLAAMTILGAFAAYLPAQTPTLQRISVATSLTPTPEVVLPPEQLGDLQMVRKRYQAAIEAYAKVSPRSSNIWNKIGIASQQMLMNEAAKKSYEAALKLDPKSPDVLNNLGSVYYARKDYRRAEHLYRKALRFRPRSALIFKNLGTDLLAEDKFNQGWECYETALSIDPEIFERSNQLRIGEPTPIQKRGAMNYYLAKSYARAGMTDRAVGYLRMAIDEGFADRKKVLADKEFASLHGLTSFEQLISEQQIQ